MDRKFASIKESNFTNIGLNIQYEYLEIQRLSPKASIKIENRSYPESATDRSDFNIELSGQIGYLFYPGIMNSVWIGYKNQHSSEDVYSFYKKFFGLETSIEL